MFENILDYIDFLSRQVDTPDFPWLYFLYSVLAGGSLLEFYIDSRQYFFLPKATVPQEVSSFVDEENFQKTKAYKRAKLRFSMFYTVYSATLNILIYSAGVYPRLWEFTSNGVDKIGISYIQGNVGRNVAFFTVYSIIQALISVPLDWYNALVLEESFGFNKSTPAILVADFFKSQLVGAVLSGLVIGSIVRIIDWAGKSFFVFATLFAISFSLIMQVLAPTIIQPLFNKFTPLEEGELRTAVHKLAARLAFPLTKLYVIDGSKRSSHSNAYFIGLPWYKQIVLFDTLIDKCSTGQIVAVLGHELGHWKLNHIPKNLILVTGLIFSTFLSFAIFVDNKSLYNAVGLVEPQPLTVRLLIFFDLVSPIAPAFQLLSSYLSRKYEYEADEFAVSLGYGRDLIDSLVVMQKENLSDVAADKLYSLYRFSHPILPERLRALREKTEEYERKQK